MAVHLDHTIVPASDREASAAFLAEVLGLDDPVPFGHFQAVRTHNGVTLDFVDTDDEITSRHYAFLVGDDDFEVIFGRIRARELDYWADPGRTRRGEVYQHEGGRGVYFADPDGHLLEILTRPNASGS